MQEGVAVVVRGLAVAGLQAEAAVALQHQRAARLELQREGEAVAAGPHVHAGFRPPGKGPVVDPGAEGGRLRAGVPYPAAGQALCSQVIVRGGDAGMAHPDVAVVPAGRVRVGAQSVAEQGPLGAVVVPLCVPEIGGDVPPLDAEARMGAVVGGEDELPAGLDLRVFVARAPQAREAFRRRRLPAAAPGQQQDRGQHPPPSAHW